MLDAHAVQEHLWVGAIPSTWTGIARRFDLVVLCAATATETLPMKPWFVVVDLYDDHRPVPEQVFVVARQVASALLKRSQVLVACVRGQNRSGLVAALAPLSRAAGSDRLRDGQADRGGRCRCGEGSGRSVQAGGRPN